MVTGTEMKALKTVGKENGKTSTRLVSRQLGIDPAYANVLCMNLTKGAYLDQERRGCFQITVKGKKALKWSSDVLQAPSAEAQRGKIHVEEFHWRSLSAVHVGNGGCGSAFLKPGQEAAGWDTMSVGNNGHNRVKGGNGMAPHSLLTGKSHMCGFCRGRGYRQKGVSCPVCRGTGSVTVIPPAIPCAYCKGTGEAQRRTPLKCTVCGGKGVVHVSKPVTLCSRCMGTGEDPNSKLPCLKCHGKGMVKEQSYGRRAQTPWD